MACTTCRASYSFHRVIAPNGGQVTIAEGVVPLGKEHSLVVVESVDKDTRTNVLGIAMGTLRYNGYPDGFTPVLLPEGATSDDIPPYPAGTYSLIADDHCVFYCINADDGVARPRGAIALMPAQRLTLARGTIAVVLNGAVRVDGAAENETGPAILIAQSGDISFECVVAAKLIFMEQAVA